MSICGTVVSNMFAIVYNKKSRYNNYARISYVLIVECYIIYVNTNGAGQELYIYIYIYIT